MQAKDLIINTGKICNHYVMIMRHILRGKYETFGLTVDQHIMIITITMQSLSADYEMRHLV